MANGQKAFPRPGFDVERYSQEGMTTRIYIAARVLPALAANAWKPEMAAEYALKYADALLAAAEKP